MKNSMKTKKQDTANTALAAFKGKAKTELVEHAALVSMSVDAFVRLCVKEMGWQIVVIEGRPS